MKKNILVGAALLCCLFGQALAANVYCPKVIKIPGIDEQPQTTAVYTQCEDFSKRGTAGITTGTCPYLQACLCHHVSATGGKANYYLIGDGLSNGYSLKDQATAAGLPSSCNASSTVTTPPTGGISIGDGGGVIVVAPPATNVTNTATTTTSQTATP